MIAKKSFNNSMGWLPDLPDFRDYRITHDDISDKKRALGQEQSVKQMLGYVGVIENESKSLDKPVDLRRWCSSIEDQESLGSCTAQATAALVEYFERRVSGNHIDASRLFLYKVSRNLLHFTGDTGAYLRAAMGALVLFGVPPEEYWPYVVEDFEKEPPSFCYAFAQNYKAINYYRLDHHGISRKALLRQIKLNLLAGLPSMFGFTVFSSIGEAQGDGKIPFPSDRERRRGGHAVTAVGYDNSIKIVNKNDDEETEGALLIRNSWGETWGDKGYGWLPYKYVEKGLAIDWWSLIKQDWIETKEFQI